ncbi:DUF2750 domain-containing protein [Rhizobium leguminosarum]|uniref:DUF2750 domain-containing protein n=1 Tax=Rhizobium leguminosarum TaxID=384 RepID=UPI001C953278|nr:DUF2750 domain-containing protein [Rhizobium leguminosarum]
MGKFIAGGLFWPIAEVRRYCLLSPMSIAAAHTHAFFNEVTENGFVWTIRDDAGFPTSTNQSKEAAMPFWSSEIRARRIIDQVLAYRGFTPHRLPVEVFLDRWLQGLEQDNLRVGINWSGVRATGFDIAPADVRRGLHNVSTR